jgi:hypothetical protein
VLSIVKGMDNTKLKRKPWKNKMERDILFSKDLKEAGLQGGKAFGGVTKKIFHKKKDIED